MGLPEIFFYYFAIVAVLTALLAITRVNPVYSVLFLMLCFFHIAGLFLLLGAEFLAFLQIWVQAGALMMLFLFVVFILNLSEIKETRFIHRQSMVAGIVGIVLIVTLIITTVRGVFPGPYKELIQSQVGDNTSYVASHLFTTFLFPFELASLVLLVVMFGAVILAKREKQE
jgi:NADH-quinone oxidoreductase subunit J